MADFLGTRDSNVAISEDNAGRKVLILDTITQVDSLVGNVDSAEGVFDLVKIPTGKIVPGVQVHANIIENILSKDFLKTNYVTKIAENIILLISLIVILVIANYFKPIYP